MSNSRDNLNSRDAYDDWHTTYAVDEQADTLWHRLVKAHLTPADLRGKRILEIGCGRGGLACWLARQPETPREIVAADFSSAAVEKGRAFAKERAISSITWEVGDIQAIAHPAQSFDTVISCETVEQSRAYNPTDCPRQYRKTINRLTFFAKGTIAEPETDPVKPEGAEVVRRRQQQVSAWLENTRQLSHRLTRLGKMLRSNKSMPWGTTCLFPAGLKLKCRALIIPVR